MSIVNRRGSDLTDKSDGVLYTSDGRDVEMSVASTKAFYAQIAAGFLLAFAIADEVVRRDGRRRTQPVDRRSPASASCPTRWRPRSPAVRRSREAAQELAPSRALLGDRRLRVGPHRRRGAAHQAVRALLQGDRLRHHRGQEAHRPVVGAARSSSAPPVSRGSNADDVAKEVAIYRAHKAKPIVIATDGEERFSAALRVLTVPAIHPELSFVLGTVAGHLFGYEAALAIDAQALPLREARGAIEEAVSVGGVLDGDRLLAGLSPAFGPLASRFFDGLRTGAYDGHLEASTAVRLTSLFRFATGVAPLDAYELEWGRSGAPSVLIEDLTAALTDGIEELPARSTPSSTRPRRSPSASRAPTRDCSRCRSCGARCRCRPDRNDREARRQCPALPRHAQRAPRSSPVILPALGPTDTTAHG